MCLVVLSFEVDPRFRLAMASNRDEFFARATASAAYWPEEPRILGGRDLEHGGTWQGITRDGRFAVLTNYRDLPSIRPDAPSRGQLVSDYLRGSGTAEAYAREIESRKERYNDFNLLVGRLAADPARSELWYVGTRAGAARQLPPGTYGLSNHVLDTPWPKLSRAKQAFQEVLAAAAERAEPRIVESMFEFLSWPERAADHELPSTGVPLELERALSPLFVRTPDYGTRCSTVVLADRMSQFTLVERPFSADGRRGADIVFTGFFGLTG
ncbi:MAG: NRDE family protein [Oligoflexia bacterium]|nr:NRDE family protein [Oligoflexia bacterium]